MTANRKGLFVTLEGGEGAGKSVQCDAVRDHLGATGHSVTVTREPGGTALGERLRAILLDLSSEHLHIDPFSETLLFLAARAELVTDMALVNDRLWVSGLSNEEFSSKLRSVQYPFKELDHGASVEIFHGSHGQFETRSPVYAFVPLPINGEPYLIAGYLCTPLVKFPIASLKPGVKIRGVTIAELGNGNRPLDMVAYKKDGRDYLLMSNTSRGVMKIPSETFASAAPITTPVQNEKAGVAYQTISQWRGIEQLDLLDAEHAVLLASGSAGLDLRVAVLP